MLTINCTKWSSKPPARISRALDQATRRHTFAKNHPHTYTNTMCVCTRRRQKLHRWAHRLTRIEQKAFGSSWSALTLHIASWAFPSQNKQYFSQSASWELSSISFILSCASITVVSSKTLYLSYFKYIITSFVHNLIKREVCLRTQLKSSFNIFESNSSVNNVDNLKTLMIMFLYYMKHRYISLFFFQNETAMSTQGTYLRLICYECSAYNANKP